jgi:YgiT-type zinc finger domain-containing protein
MEEKECPCYGSASYRVPKTDYSCSKQDKYLLVKQFPVEICDQCGMTYYDGRLLEKVERTFIAIYEEQAQPDDQVSMPVTVCA